MIFMLVGKSHKGYKIYYVCIPKSCSLIIMGFEKLGHKCLNDILGLSSGISTQLYNFDNRKYFKNLGSSHQWFMTWREVWDFKED
jgi:hypothetical protein